MRRPLLCATIATLCAAVLCTAAEARHRRSHWGGFGFARVDEGIGLRHRGAPWSAEAPARGAAVAARSDEVPGPQGWAPYLNRDAGMAVDYPANVFSIKDGAAEKGTGDRFRTADGRAQLTVYALPNADGDTPRSYLDRHLLIDRSKLDYGLVTDRFFAISGIRDARTFYSRCNFPGAPRGTMHCVYLEYPAADTRAWDAIVTRISRSLRAGSGDRAEQ